MLCSLSVFTSKHLTFGALGNSYFRRQWLGSNGSFQTCLRKHDHGLHRSGLRLLAVPDSFKSRGVSSLAYARPMTVSHQASNAAAMYLPRKTLSRRTAKQNLDIEDPVTPLQSGVTGRGLAVGISTVVLLIVGYLYVTDTRAGFHRWLVVPVLRTLYSDAEEAHRAGVMTLKVLYQLGLQPRERGDQDGPGKDHVEVFGHRLKNSLAISAGLDKDAEIVSPLFGLGPAIVEIGGVTPLPQDGNPKPRVWRIPSQQALINRYGLNSKGAAHVARQLRHRVRDFGQTQGLGIDEKAQRLVLDGYAGVPPGSLNAGQLLAVQIAKNKDTPEHDTEAVKQDYVWCVNHLAEYADIIVVNVSSPNTPGLRSLQKMEPLRAILTGVVQATRSTRRRTKPAVMVKVSPDETAEDDIQGICKAVWQSGVDGVIVANTTKQRPPLSRFTSQQEAAVLQEQGGYSGPFLFERTLELVGKYRQALDMPLGAAVSGSQAKIPKIIFASGGISCGEDVLRVRAAGASVAMTYTQMIYEGSGFITSMKRQMRELANRPHLHVLSQSSS